MKNAKRWIEIKKELSTTVAYIAGNHGRRAFDAVVVEIRNPNAHWDNQQPRRVVLKTSGRLHLEKDIERVRRFIRRLKRMGLVFTNSLRIDNNCGACGTLFAYWRSAS